MAFKFNFGNKECLITFVVAIIGVIIFFWMIYPSLTGANGNGMMVSEEFERFNPEEEQVIMPEEAAVEDTVPGPSNGEQEHAPILGPSGNGANGGAGGPGDSPFVDPRTGTMMDGPGFEKCEIEGTPEVTSSAVPANYYFLDDGAGGEMSIQHNLCSKSCCSEQWPTPFKQKYDPYVCNNKDQFVPKLLG